MKYFLDARCDNKRPQAGVGHVRGRHQARQGLGAPGRRALQQVGTGFKELWKAKTQREKLKIPPWCLMSISYLHDGRHQCPPYVGQTSAFLFVFSSLSRENSRICRPELASAFQLICLGLFKGTLVASHKHLGRHRLRRSHVLVWAVRSSSMGRPRLSRALEQIGGEQFMNCW